MTINVSIEKTRYAKCVAASKRVHWTIDEHVIRGRDLTLDDTFLPSSLSKVADLDFLTADEKRFMSQVQGRTYANIFGLVERFINAKILEVTTDHWLGDQDALEALVRFSNEEIKHQELFRRVEAMCADIMPAGYRFLPDPNGVAKAVLSKSTWSVLALTCFIEIFVLSHYKQAIDSDDSLSPLFKDVFMYHARDEAQHIIADELEWERVHNAMSPLAVDAAVDDFIALVGAVDDILQLQAAADVEYFCSSMNGGLYEENLARLKQGVLAAYRWQYIASGVGVPRFQEALGAKIKPQQFERISAALAPIMGSA
ncbi:MAG: hypothetical protein K1X35_04125 [Caulobacteraceae bacterium]|nr:hypothetical protein [Caulobacteraceae bacterium]